MTLANAKVLYAHRLDLKKPVDDILKRYPELEGTHKVAVEAAEEPVEAPKGPTEPSNMEKAAAAKASKAAKAAELAKSIGEDHGSDNSSRRKKR